MTEIWIDVQSPWPLQICVLAAVVEMILIVVTQPRWLRILRDKAHREGGASKSYIRRILLAQGTILALSALAVAALYGYDLSVSQMEGSILGEEGSWSHATLPGLLSLVPILVGIGLWGWLGVLVRRSAGRV